MRTKKYTKENVEQFVKESFSYCEVLRKLGLKPAGGNYNSLKNLIKNLNLDTSHFTYQLWNKGKKTGPKRKLDEYLSNNHSINSHKLRLRLLNEELFEHKCQNCQLTNWLDNLIPLELHHIDGNNQNNNLSNLSLLCPNCHALTENYRGKNIK